MKDLYLFLIGLAIFYVVVGGIALALTGSLAQAFLDTTYTLLWLIIIYVLIILFSYVLNMM